MDELELTLQKIRDSEDLIRRAEEFFKERRGRWSDGLTMSFEILLERKREQLHYERHYAERLGWRIALDRDERDVDI